MPRNQHPPEFQEQALSKVRARGKRTLESVAAELNMPLGTLKGWLKRSGLEGAASRPANGAPHSDCWPCKKATPFRVPRCTHGVARRVCSSTNSSSGAMPSAPWFRHPWSAPPRSVLPTPHCASCKPATTACSARCAAKIERWPRPPPCWCFKKSSKPWSCSNRRARTHEHPGTT